MSTLIRRVVAAVIADDYGEQAAGASFEAETFLPALSRFFPDLVLFPQDRELRDHGYFAANERLRSLCWAAEPTLLFVVPFENQLDWTVIREISARENVVTLAWMCDDHWRYDDFSRHVSHSFDFVATTDVDAFLRYHAESSAVPILTQWGYDEHRFQPSDDEPLHDVSFVGQCRPHRVRFIRALERAGVRVTTRGRGWPAGRATTQELADIPARSRISLNFADASTVAKGRRTQLKARPFELAGTRTCVVTEADAQLATYFEVGRELVTFRGVRECVDAVTHLLSRPEDAAEIAARGHHRALHQHTYSRRLSSLFAAMGVSTVVGQGAAEQLCATS